MQQPTRILICPLDWGLGHAARCIPVIRELLEKKATVIIAADGNPYELLLLEFPTLQLIRLPGPEIRYSASGRMALQMLFSIPGILHGIRKEHKALDTIIKEHQIDIVISDNRYGCWNKRTKNIFITHQLMIKAPFGEKLIHSKVLRYLRNFDECWIPDVPGKNNLSGDLSHYFPLPPDTYFIGPLSRLKHEAPGETISSLPLVIASGPEPQRTIFEDLVTAQLKKYNLPATIVSGTFRKEKNVQQEGNRIQLTHLTSEGMQRMITQAPVILSRSGYSTVMDLAVLHKKAIFIPTPGQTEQEYLAAELMKKGIAFSMRQSEFDLQKAIKESENYTGFSGQFETGGLRERIDVMLSGE